MGERALKLQAVAGTQPSAVATLAGSASTGPVTRTRARRRRVFVEDARGDGSYLRATWHAERRVFVVSTWRGDVCTGAVRLPVGDAAELMGLLADGMAEAAVTPVEVDRPSARALVQQRWRSLRGQLSRWMRRGPATPGK